MSDKQAALPEALTVVKRYDILKNSTFTYRELEIQHNGKPFLWTFYDQRVFHTSTLSLQTESSRGPVVAGARFPRMTSDVDVTIGDPAKASDENFVTVQRQGFTGASYTFPGVDTGHLYEWRRTHNADLGSTRLSNSDFKLVDPSNSDKLLAVYIKDSFFGGSQVAHIDFMVTLEGDLELQAITAVLAIEERLRQARQKNHAGAGTVAGTAGFGVAAGAGGGGGGGGGC